MSDIYAYLEAIADTHRRCTSSSLPLSLVGAAGGRSVAGSAGVTTTATEPAGDAVAAGIGAAAAGKAGTLAGAPAGTRSIHALTKPLRSANPRTVPDGCHARPVTSALCLSLTSA